MSEQTLNQQSGKSENTLKLSICSVSKKASLTRKKERTLDRDSRKLRACSSVKGNLNLKLSIYNECKPSRHTTAEAHVLVNKEYTCKARKFSSEQNLQERNPIRTLASCKHYNSELRVNKTQSKKKWTRAVLCCQYKPRLGKKLQ